MIKLNDWEIAFIGRLVEYYKLYKGSSIKMQTVIEILSKEMAIDVQKVLDSFYTLLKKSFGLIKPSDLITHKFNFDEINKAFKVARDPKAIKVIINIGGGR